MATPKIPNRQNYGLIRDPIVLDKQRLIDSYLRAMQNRTERIFDWRGLPDSIPAKDLEFILQNGGFAFIVKNEGKGAASPDGKLYAVYGGMGGECDAYYIPTIATIANPWLKFDGQLKIGEECEEILNDSMYSGLRDINEKYACLIAETDLSIRIATINSRIVKLIRAGSDTIKTSADEYLKQVEEGKHLGVIGGDDFMDQFKSEDYASSQDGTHIKELIELQQYLKSQWFIELGLNSNYNMKREAINAAESGMNDDILMPLIDDMLNQRKLACERVNRMFGTSWSVELSSSWKQNKMEEEIALDQDPKKGGNEDEDPNRDTPRPSDQ